MKKVFFYVLTGLLLTTHVQAQEGFSIKDLYEWSRKGTGTDPTPTPTPTSEKSTLYAGERLNTGEKMYSSNGAYLLAMQEDGNLCIYTTRSNGFVWCNMAHGFRGATLIMQEDGNLVVYDGKNDAKWSSKTHPYFNAQFRDTRNKPVKLVLENDGRLNLYTAKGLSVWSNK